MHFPSSALSGQTNGKHYIEYSDGDKRVDILLPQHTEFSDTAKELLMPLAKRELDMTDASDSAWESSPATKKR